MRCAIQRPSEWEENEKIIVIPNFVELDRFDPRNVSSTEIRKAFGWSDGVPVIAMLGWCTPTKGAMVAIEAMPQVLVNQPEAKLLLFGTGAPPNGAGTRGFRFYRRIMQRVKELGIGHAVQFAGAVFNIADYIDDVDIVLAPFTVPHFARPILEAGAMRKIVVTSDIDGTREMVLYGEAGYLARPADVSDLARCMVQALENNNSERIERMYQNVVDNYNAAHNAERTLLLYDNL